MTMSPSLARPTSQSTMLNRCRPDAHVSRIPGTNARCVDTSVNTGSAPTVRRDRRNSPQGEDKLVRGKLSLIDGAAPPGQPTSVAHRGRKHRRTAAMPTLPAYAESVRPVRHHRMINGPDTLFEAARKKLSRNSTANSRNGPLISFVSQN